MALYDLTTLLEMNKVQKSLPSFWLKYFPTQINFDTEKVAFDQVWTDDRGLAPFVVPNVQGRVLGMDGYETKEFKPAYVKPKHVIDPNMVIERQAGEALGTGSMSIEQRRNVVVMELLRKHRVLHDNRREWLAAKAIIDGKVTISGEDYPSTLVDFRRHASLTNQLTGTARWDQSATANPMGDLKALRVTSNYRSGARIQTFVFGADAWDMFSSRVDLRSQMNLQIDGFGTKVSMLADGYEGYEYMGTIAGLNGAGRMECWVNTAKFTDDDNAEQFLQAQNTVVGVSPSVSGVRCFGAIKDKQAGYRALDFFPKAWEEEDPSVEYLLSQSAPLMVPKMPNATFKLTVN